MANLSDYLGAIVNKVFNNFKANASGGSYDQSLSLSPSLMSKNTPSIPNMNTSTAASSASVAPTPAVASPLPSDYVYNPQSAQVAPNLEDIIKAGLSKFGDGNPLIATASSQLAQAGQGLPDQLLPTILALMETQGGKTQVANNNPFNINDGTGFVQYPDLTTAILGGGDRQGMAGLLNGPYYDKYRQTGNIQDFFNTYTPPGPEHGNPSLEELVSRYLQIKSSFPQAGSQ